MLTFLTLLSRSWLAAVEGLVDLDLAAQRSFLVVGEQGPNLLEHPMGGLVGDADFSLKLLGADATAGAAHQVDRVEPKLKADRRLVENGPCGRVDVVAAELAAIGRPSGDPVELARLLALRALGAV